jgi:hypothetical protein
MTSLERKTRAVNSTDIASQFANTLGKDAPVKKLKSKNSELLSKYREKIKGDSDTAELENERINSEAEEEENSGRAIPKVKRSFKGVNFDTAEEESVNQRQENKKRPWRKGKNFTKKTSANDNNKNSGKKRFKPFKRNNNKKTTNKERF